jgi:hypothetical protein
MALTRTEVSQETLVVFRDADDVYHDIRSAFAEVGKIKTEDSAFRRVVGRIFSGTGRMNPATVTVTVRPVSATESHIDIQASAQEGLVKQHTAPRAISRLLESLGSANLPMTPPVDDDVRTCPWCAETIKIAAKICRYCGRDVDPYASE